MLKRLFVWLARHTSYGLAVAVFSVLGGQVASFLGVLFILATTDLTTTGTRHVLLAAVSPAVLAATVIHYVRFGLGRRFYSGLESPLLHALNEHIYRVDLDQLPTETLRQIVCATEQLPMFNTRLCTLLSATVVLVAIVAEVYASGSWRNGLSILRGGVISVLLYAMFTLSITELITASVRRRVRRILVRRGAWSEASYHTRLRLKLIFFIILIGIGMTISSALAISPKRLIYQRLAVALTLAVGSLMAYLVFRAITLPLWEIQEMARYLAQAQRADFVSSSTDREFLTAAQNLYAVAVQLMHYRNRLNALNRELGQRERKRTAELMELYQAVLDLSHWQMGHEAALQALVERTTHLLNADSGSIWLWNAERALLELVAYYDRMGRPQSSTTLPPGEGISGQVWESGKPLYVNDYQHWSGRSRLWAERHGIRAALSVPLSWQGRASGVFTVSSRREGAAFDDHDQRLLSTLAGQAAATLENALLFQAHQQRIAELEAKQRQWAELLRVSNLLRADLDLQEILQHVANAMHDTIGYQSVLINLIEGDPPYVHRVAHSGIPEEGWEALRRDTYPAEELAALIQEQFRISGTYYIPYEARATFEGRFRYVLGPGDPPRTPGRWHPQDILIVPLRDSRGEIIGYISVDEPADGLQPTRATVEQLELFANQASTAVHNARMLARLAQERNTLSIVINNIADGLVVTDCEGTITLSNPVFANIVGQEETALVGQHLPHIFPAQELPALLDNALQKPGQVFTHNLLAPRGRVYRASACALKPNGEVLGVVTVLRDVTREVEIDRMKTYFISVVSHELRTPLTSVLGFAKLIDKNLQRVIIPLVPAQNRRGWRTLTRIQQNLGIIISEGERLARLINDMLDISKMEAGKIEWRSEETDILHVITTAIASMAAMATQKHLTIRMEEPDEPLPTIQADPDRLTRVVTNLLSNAIKFTDRGEIVVGVRLWKPGETIEPFGVRQPGFTPRPPTEAPYLLVSVTDSGIGIARDDMRKLFEKFVQVGDQQGRLPGTGLGLSICREIIEHHGGQIWAESILGQGSRFLFTLPT